jgi:hypothetical protein
LGNFALPDYVPAGYEMRDCIYQEEPWTFSYAYVKDNEFPEFYAGYTSYSIAAYGGIQISYHNELSKDTHFSFSHSYISCEEKIQVQEESFCFNEYAISSYQARHSNIKNPQIVNVTNISNNDEGYHLSSTLPQEELIKIAKSLVSQNTELKNTSEIINGCKAAGGDWLDEHNECESGGITEAFENYCSDFDGTYYGCHSGCRHSPDWPDVVCIAQCFAVCEFN